MTVSVIPSLVLCSRPVQDATTRIEEIIFSIATYLNLGSQARVMTEAGFGVAWIRGFSGEYNILVHIQNQNYIITIECSPQEKDEVSMLNSRLIQN